MQSVPPDAATKFVVPTTEDEASGFLGASQISAIMGEFKGFQEGDDDPGVIIVIFIVPVATSRGRFIARDGRFGVPVRLESMKMAGEDGLINCGIKASGAEQGGERGGLAPHIIRRGILRAFDVDTFGRVPKSFLDMLHHLPCFIGVLTGAG